MFANTAADWNIYSIAQMLDGSTANATGCCPDARVTADFKMDFGLPYAMTKVGMYVNNVVHPGDTWGVWWSDDGVTYTRVATWAPPASIGWGYTSWAYAGIHRYWKAAIEINTASANSYFTELEWYFTALNAIYITGAATVAPDSNTGAAVFSAQNVVVDGAGASLKPSMACKGLLGFVSGQVSYINGAGASMSALGKGGAFGDVNPYDLAPLAIRRKLSRAKLAPFTMKGQGAAPGARCTNSATNGTAWYAPTPAAAGPMQTGGGVGGAIVSNVQMAPGSRGGCGGPCCGGSCGGGIQEVAVARGTLPDAADFGGKAGDYVETGSSIYAWGGAPGDPLGTTGVYGTATQASGPGGGVLWLLSPQVFVGPSSILQADGPVGGAGISASYLVGAPGGGAGAIVIGTSPGGLTNLGTIRANGGLAGSGGFNGNANPGGMGSVNLLTVN